MKEFSIAALAEIIKASHGKNIKGTFSGISTDSRNIKPGECFFTLCGDNFDGHNFIEDVFRKGAAIAVPGVDNRRGTPARVNPGPRVADRRRER